MIVVEDAAEINRELGRNMYVAAVLREILITVW